MSPEHSDDAPAQTSPRIAEPEDTRWTQAEALSLCREIEAYCPQHGAHVALTGGLLYKDGPRKDADILFYRIRQVEEIDYAGLFETLKLCLGIEKTGGFGWCHKALWNGKKIDFFFPDETGVYEREDDGLLPITEEEVAF